MAGDTSPSYIALSWKWYEASGTCIWTTNLSLNPGYKRKFTRDVLQSFKDMSYFSYRFLGKVGSSNSGLLDKQYKWPPSTSYPKLTQFKLARQPCFSPTHIWCATHQKADSEQCNQGTKGKCKWMSKSHFATVPEKNGCKKVRSCSAKRFSQWQDLTFKSFKSLPLSLDIPRNPRPLLTLAATHRNISESSLQQNSA